MRIKRVRVLPLIRESERRRRGFLLRHFMQKQIQNRQLWTDIPDLIVNPDVILSDRLLRDLRNRDTSLRGTPFNVEWPETAIASAADTTLMQFDIFLPDYTFGIVVGAEMKVGAGAGPVVGYIRIAGGGGSVGVEQIVASESYVWARIPLIFTSVEIADEFQKIDIRVRKDSFPDADGSIRMLPGNMRSHYIHSVAG